MVSNWEVQQKILGSATTIATPHGIVFISEWLHKPYSHIEISGAKCPLKKITHERQIPKGLDLNVASQVAYRVLRGRSTKPNEGRPKNDALEIWAFRKKEGVLQARRTCWDPQVDRGYISHKWENVELLRDAHEELVEEAERWALHKKRYNAERDKAVQYRVSKHPWLLDILAPKHRPGRYGVICSDQDPCRGTSFDTSRGKDPRCPRCLILEAVSDFENETWVEKKPVLLSTYVEYEGFSADPY